MARQWTGSCIQCGSPISYADQLALRDASLGRPRSVLCQKCERLEKRGLRATAVPEVLLGSKTVQSGAPLGQIETSDTAHQLDPRPSRMIRRDFGILDDEIRVLYDELSREDTPVVIAVAPTGSGKSTFLPYRLLVPEGLPDDTFTAGRQIVITQPRRGATIGITDYVAGTLHGANVGVGHEIGYRVRGDNACDWRNRMVYVTDGTLVNWIVRGELDRISLIIIDEAHERSLNIDVILGLLTNVLPQYPHLKMMIVSATIDHEKFRRFFDARLPGNMRCGIVECSGSKPVGLRIHWRKPSSGKLPFERGALKEFGRDVWRHLADAIVRLVVEMDSPEGKGHQKLEQGDVLGFLHGAKPIQDACDHIKARLQSEYPQLDRNTDVYPLYAAVDEDTRKKAIGKKKDPSRRRIVIASNAAETSLTIDSLVHVVDSGFIKQTEWNPVLEQAPLLPIAHSQAGCRQRWGRVGRKLEGFAWSIYTKEQFEQVFARDTTPVIQRACLDDVILKAKRGGADRIGGDVFPWLDAPDDEEIKRSTERLSRQGLIDKDGDLTNTGVEAALSGGEDALYARVIADADRLGFGIEMATLLPFIKEGLGDLLPDDRDWEPEKRRAIRSAQDQLRGACTDDLELCLRVYQDWASLKQHSKNATPSRYGIDLSVLNAVVNARADLIRQLGAKKKELEDREIDFAGLDRLRVIIARAFPEHLYIRSTEVESGDNGEARYEPVNPESSDPPLLRIDSASCCRSQPPEALVAIGPKHQNIPRNASEERALLFAPFIVKVDPSLLDVVAGLSDLALADWFREHMPRPVRGSEEDHRQKIHEALRRRYPPGTLVECRVQSVSGTGVDVQVLRPVGWGGKRLGAVAKSGTRREKMDDAKERDFDPRYGRKEKTRQRMSVQSVEEEVIDLINETIQADAEQDSSNKRGQITPFEIEQNLTEYPVDGRLRQYGVQVALKPGDLVSAEVTSHTALRARPGVLVVTPPSIERFRAFSRLYKPGMDVAVEVAGPTPPGSLQRGLQVRERVTGLEIVVPTEELALFSDPALLRSVPIGASFTLWVDSIDDRHEEVSLTGLPRLESYLQRYRTGDEDVAHSATVVSIDYDEQNIYVLVMLDDSRPDDGLIILAKIRMYRELFEQNGVLRLPYRVGDTVHTSVRVRNDTTSRCSFPRLTSRETTALDKAGVSRNQTQQLSCNERMSLEACNKLIRAAETAGLANGLRELYRTSNELFGDRIITDLEQRFPIGKHVKGTVTYIYGGGVKLALQDGVVGHVAREEITWWNQRTRVEEFVEVGDVCEGKVLNVDVGLQAVHLSFRMVFADSWQGAINKMYPLSKTVEGVVEGIQPFGAFVMLEPGLNGLVPLKGMRDFHGRFVERAEDVVRVGDRVRVRVDGIDVSRQNISLVLVARLGKAPASRETEQTKKASKPEEDLHGSVEPLGWDDPVWPWTEGENAITEQKRPEPPARPKPSIRAPLEKRPNPLSWMLTWQ